MSDTRPARWAAPTATRRWAPSGPVDPPPTAVRDAVARALAEDVGPLGDLTAGLVPAAARARAQVVARHDGVMAGRACAVETFRQVDPTVVVDWRVADGGSLEPGTVVAEVSGPVRSVLTAERSALNFVCHLSGVATMTRQFVEAVAAVNPTTRILDTRKTTPGLRALEKAAVRAGGGMNHRGNLSEGVLVKDNHLGGTSITDAVALALHHWPGRMVEVECDRLDQVEEAARAGATLILCDNMDPPTVAEAVAIVRRNAIGRCLVEASGGVSLETVAEYAKAGADVISSGALTHSAPILDIGLDLEGAAAD